MSAVNIIEGYNIKFYIYTLRTRERLEAIGIKGERVEVKDFVDPEEILSILADADVLVLALAFDTPYPDVIKTASPGKLPVYLASGTPILVHAPKESYVVNYFKKHNCGIVVDSQNVAELKNNIIRILRDKKLREHLRENMEKVIKNHDAEKVSKILQRYLGVEV